MAQCHQSPTSIHNKILAIDGNGWKCCQLFLFVFFCMCVCVFFLVVGYCATTLFVVRQRSMVDVWLVTLEVCKLVLEDTSDGTTGLHL